MYRVSLENGIAQVVGVSAESLEYASNNVWFKLPYKTPSKARAKAIVSQLRRFGICTTFRKVTVK